MKNTFIRMGEGMEEFMKEMTDAETMDMGTLATSTAILSSRTNGFSAIEACRGIHIPENNK
ncbi:MAG: hypothetical protein QM687_13050 [Ferruginibacter sp.]